jgi:hypothetical protein
MLRLDVLTRRRLEALVLVFGPAATMTRSYRKAA